MKNEEIVKALRICATHKDKGCGLCPQRKYVRCTDRLADEAITMIERLTAENAALREKQRWIPVTERMPELEVPVLVLDRRGNMIVRTLRRLVSDKEAVFRPDGLAPRKNITHWMPLPDAPEEGEKA